MNLAATVDLITASCSLLFALIWLRAARGPDGRWLGAVCATAALSSACHLAMTLPCAEPVARWGG